MEILLRGHCPSKANRLRVGARRVRLDEQVRSEIGWLQLQANQQAPARSLVHPAVTILFSQRNGAQDRDNKLKTILDVLQAARIIRNDNVHNFNGRIIIEPAILVKPGEERTLIILEESKSV